MRDGVLQISLAIYYAWAFEMCWLFLAAPFGWVLPFSMKQLIAIFFLKSFVFPSNFKFKTRAYMFAYILTPLINVAMAYVMGLFIH